MICAFCFVLIQWRCFSFSLFMFFVLFSFCWVVVCLLVGVSFCDVCCRVRRLVVVLPPFCCVCGVSLSAPSPPPSFPSWRWLAMYVHSGLYLLSLQIVVVCYVQLLFFLFPPHVPMHIAVLHRTFPRNLFSFVCFGVSPLSLMYRIVCFFWFFSCLVGLLGCMVFVLLFVCAVLVWSVDPCLFHRSCCFLLFICFIVLCVVAFLMFYVLVVVRMFVVCLVVGYVVFGLVVFRHVCLTFVLLLSLVVVLWSVHRFNRNS